MNVVAIISAPSWPTRSVQKMLLEPESHCKLYEVIADPPVLVFGMVTQSTLMLVRVERGMSKVGLYGASGSV